MTEINHSTLIEFAETMVIGGPTSHKKFMGLAEDALLRAMLKKHRGQRNKVASELGINRTTLFNKMQKFGLMDEFQRHRKKDE